MKPSTFSKNREINAIVKKLIQSKRVSFNWGGKHGKIFFLSSKKTLTVPFSPSDWRAYRNFQRDVGNIIKSDVGLIQFGY